MKVWIVLTGIALLGFFAGYLGGRHTDTATDSVRQQPQAALTTIPPVRRSHAPHRKSAQALTDLRKLFSQGQLKEMASIEEAAVALSKADIEEACRLAEALPNAITRSEASAILLRYWIKLSPNDAFAFAANHFKHDQRGAQDVMRQVISEWSKEDPRAAYHAYRETTESNNPPEYFHLYIDALFDHWKDSDFDGAWAAFQDMEDPQERDKALATFTNIASDPNKRQEWLDVAWQITDSNERLHALASSMRSWGAVASLQEVATWIDNHDMSSRERSSLEVGLAQSQVQKDPLATANWLLSRPSASDPDNRSNYIAAITGVWAQHEPNACGEWLSSLEAGPDLDGGIASFASAIVRDDPESAFQWALSINSPDQKHATLRHLVKRWHTWNPTAANQAVSDANLTEDVKQIILPENRVRDHQ